MGILVNPTFPARRDHRYHADRPRVTLHPADLKGHRLLSMGRFLLTKKHVSTNDEVMLSFENSSPSAGSVWKYVGRTGVIRIPVGTSESRSYMEGCAYNLYLYQW